MKTWRQGNIGRVGVEGGQPVYLHCLTYPLARLYGRFEAADALAAPGDFVRVRLEDFGAVDVVGSRPLTAAERRQRVEAPWSAWAGPRQPAHGSKHP